MINPINKIKSILYNIMEGRKQRKYSTNNKKTEEKNTQNFQKLTPINDIDLTIYKDALDFVFKNNDLKNVAISGPYSSGKSSIIETYKKLYQRKIFLHISLAHFVEMEDKDNIDEKINEPRLEGKILNQLLHQIDIEKIPQTNFKVKKNISFIKVFLYTSLITMSMIFILFISLFHKWKIFVCSLPETCIKNILGITVTDYSQIFIGILFFVMLSLIIYKTLKMQINKSIIKRLSFQGSSFELFDENTPSYFDKYLNEVLYIFKNSQADVIVFEDIDRYNSNQIFEKLREINTLINYGKNNIVRFFYLLRDDIFSTKDRTKFFDFIIPIIPVIDGSNSYDQFIKQFRESGIIDRFDTYFLQELSLYIDDMRILKNVYNEYIIYYNKIGSIELDNDKLLAMIVYKNLFPRDFCDLQLSKGYVYSLFSQKPIFISDELEKIAIKIAEIDNKIEIYKTEHMKDLEELDTLYISFLNKNQLIIDGHYSETPMPNLDITKAIKSHPDGTEIRIGGSWQSLDIKNAITSLNKNTDYNNRKKNISDKLTKSLDDLILEKVHLQKLLDTIHNKTLKDILNKENIENIFSKDDKQEDFSAIKSSDYFQLIKYLIRSGHIDETYPDYMTYFYPNSIAKEDKIFLRSITDRNAKDYNYKIKNAKTIITRLKSSYFEQEEVLNYDLFFYLIENGDKYGDLIKSIFNQLALKKNIGFIINFMETRNVISPVLKYVVDFWPNFLELSLNSQSAHEKQRNKLIFDVMSKLSENDIIKFNDKRFLTDHLSKSTKFLSMQYIDDIKSMINKLKKLSVSFVKFEHDGINREIFDAVYKNDLYQLNFDTISFILDIIYNIKDIEIITHKNYTSILSKSDEPLFRYIHENIDDYVDIILGNCQETINDDESAAIKLLNNMDIDDDYKEKYIGKLKSTVTNISDIENIEYWDSLIQNKCIKFCEDNVFHYYCEDEKGLNETLIKFLNNHDGVVIFSTNDLIDKYDEDKVFKFIDDIIVCDELSNTIYEKIISNSLLFYDIFDKKQISGDKIIILINTKTITMTEENLVFLRDEYPTHVLSFVMKNLTKYIDLINENNVVYSELINLLEEKISDNDKIELMKKTEEEITIKNKYYSESVKIYILKNNFCSDDIPYLFEVFNNESESVKSTIITVISWNIDLLLTDQFVVPSDILKLLLKHREMDYFKKRSLFAKYIETFNINQIKESLELMEARDYLQLFENKRPKLFINTTNEKILSVMKNKNMIEKFGVDKRNNQYYRVYGRIHIYENKE